MEVMVAASKEMSQFMGQQNPEQRRRKRKPRQKSARISIKQRESPQQFIDGHGLVVRVRHGELRACDKAGAERKQKKENGENQRFHGRAGRNLCVIPLTHRIGTPIRVSWYR